MTKNRVMECRSHNSRALDGVRIVEFAGLGPLPYACMLMADMGAEVVRIDRPGPSAPPDPTDRGRLTSLTLDLKDAAQVGIVRQVMNIADVVVEGFRPGV